MQDSWKENLDDGPPLLSLGSQPWKASPASDPSSSASSAVVDNASAEVKASSTSSQNSDNSGTTLKEHDYIGLAEVSSASVSLHRQEKTSLSLEDDTDLNLGLGLGLGPAKKAEPVDDGEKTLTFQQDNVNPVVETAKPFAWSTKEGPNSNPNQKFQAAPPPVFGFAPGRVAPAPTQAAIAKNGMKRGYTEAMTDPSRFNMAPPPAAPPMVVKNADADVKPVPKHQQPAFIPSWAAPKPAPRLEQPSAHSFAAAPAPYVPANKPAPVVVPATPKPADCTPPPAYKPHEASEAAHDNSNDEAPPAKGRVVGWPPIRSYRKNTLAKPSEMFVKVNMDGVTVGRKVDLNAHNSYEGLLLALEEMFQPSNTTGTPQAAAGSVSDGKHFRLLNGSDYVLTYEDKDGDWMLVGDVPWSMFTNTVRRLRIQRGTEATGLAPRASEKVK